MTCAQLPVPAWPQVPDSTLQRLLLALGESLARANRSSDDRFRETGPRPTGELLEHWEAALGLPGPCDVAGGQTLSERVQAAVTRRAASGGQSRAYFIVLAAALGHPEATISERQTRRHGRGRIGEAYAGADWEEVWQLNLPAQPVSSRQSGQACGERYGAWGDAQLECIVSRDKPAGSIVLFSYGGL